MYGCMHAFLKLTVDTRMTEQRQVHCRVDRSGLILVELLGKEFVTISLSCAFGPCFIKFLTEVDVPSLVLGCGCNIFCSSILTVLTILFFVGLVSHTLSNGGPNI
jgi:hypothetical protein